MLIMGTITGVITGDKNTACDTCSCGNLILPTGPAGPAGAIGPAGPAGPAGSAGSVLIKKAQYYNVAIGGGAAISTWTDLFSWTFTPGAGEIYKKAGGGFRFENTFQSCDEDGLGAIDNYVLYRLLADGNPIYYTGDHTSAPTSLIDFKLQKHRMVMAWDDTNSKWGGRVEIIGSNNFPSGTDCVTVSELFSGNINEQVNCTLDNVGLLNPIYETIALDGPNVVFTWQYMIAAGSTAGGSTVKMQEILAEFIPAP